MEGVGHSHPINETMLVCRVIGNVHTVASVYGCVVGGEYELGVYADGGSYSCVCWECTLMLGVKNVIWYVGRLKLNSECDCVFYRTWSAHLLVSVGYVCDAEYNPVQDNINSPVCLISW